VKVGDSSRRRWKRETEKDREKRERRDIRSILRRHERRRSIAVDTVPSSTRCSRPSIGWKQRITRRENRLTRLAIDPTGNLSRPSLLTRRANKGEIPRPFRGIKYLGAIYLLRSFLSTLSPACPFFLLFLLPLSTPTPRFHRGETIVSPETKVNSVDLKFFHAYRYRLYNNFIFNFLQSFW